MQNFMSCRMGEGWEGGIRNVVNIISLKMGEWWEGRGGGWKGRGGGIHNVINVIFCKMGRGENDIIVIMSCNNNGEKKMPTNKYHKFVPNSSENLSPARAGKTLAFCLPTDKHYPP